MMHGNASWGWGGARKGNGHGGARKGSGRKPLTPAARRRTERREKVAALRNAGWTQREISRELGMSQGSVRNDLDVMKQATKPRAQPQPAGPLPPRPISDTQKNSPPAESKLLR